MCGPDDRDLSWSTAMPCIPASLIAAVSLADPAKISRTKTSLRFNVRKNSKHRSTKGPSVCPSLTLLFKLSLGPPDESLLDTECPKAFIRLLFAAFFSSLEEDDAAACSKGSWIPWHEEEPSTVALFASRRLSENRWDAPLPSSCQFFLATLHKWPNCDSICCTWCIHVIPSSNVH